MTDGPERLDIPDFATESEEAQWWYDNRDLVERRLASAIKDGTARWIPPREPKRKESIEVKLTPEMAEKVHFLAARAGMKEEAYLNRLVSEALESR